MPDPTSLLEMGPLIASRRAAADTAPEIVEPGEADFAAKAPGQPLRVTINTSAIPKTPGAPNGTLPAGDALIDQARQAADFTDSQKQMAGHIKGSLDLLIQKGKEDPQFGKRAAQSLGALKGEDYAQKAIDLADEVKIDYLKKTFPDRFSGPQAAMTAFLNEATFGQMTRMIGGAGALLNGQPYEKVVAEKAEEFRLLSKAYPGLDLAGKAAAFLIPGSPVKALFESAAALGAKGAAAIIKRVVKNPGLLSKVVGSAAGGAAGAGATGAAEGFAGKDLEAPFSLDRAAEQGTRDAEVGGALGAMAPLIGAGLERGIDLATPSIQRAAKGVSRVVAKGVEELSQTRAAALRAFNRNPEAMRAAYGTEKDIGPDLVDFLLNRNRSKIEEVHAADQLLDQLPDVPAGRLVGYLRGFATGVNPENDASIKRLQEWADRIEARLPVDDAQKAAIARKRALLSAQSDIQARQISLRDDAGMKSIARKRALLSATAESQGRQHAGRQATAEAENLGLLDKKNATVPQLKAAGAELEARRAGTLEEINTSEASHKKAIEGERAGLLERQRAENARLDEAERALRSSPDLKIPARLMRTFVDELQDAASDQFGRESNLYKTALKIASRRERMAIVETAAAEGGDVGKLYVQTMAKAAEKVGVLKFIKKQLGKDVDTMAKNSQGFIDRVLGKNKDFVQTRMADLDTKFQTNFVERARQAQMASELGKGGTPSYFANIPTGRSMLGNSVGKTVGTAVGGVIGLVGGGRHGQGLGGAAIGAPIGRAIGGAVGTAASSPKLGALIVGSSDAVSGFVRTMLAKPEVLQRLAGQIAKAPSTDVGNRALARLAVPWEIRRLAQEIQTTLTKDGPRSASSVVRLVADTPYFIGLVHYFDLMEQREKRNDLRGGIQSLQTQGAPR